ncbi:MAG TPA: hypothetical protein VNU93_02560, partial [Verrucomicrobiae bacterium]|nr:hypothetical protein [Verrucomicrobiae bacterium]
VSILVRYPEVGTINVDQDLQVLKFTFFFTKDVKNPGGSRQTLQDSLCLFNQLEGRNQRVCNLEFKTQEGVTSLHVERDIETVSQNELNLLIELLRQHFNDSLISDQGEEIPEEELLMQEELIKHMLENIRVNHLDKSVIALREEGRVLVFNR